MSNTGTYKYDKSIGRLVKISDRASVSADAYFRGEYFEPHFAEKGKPFGQKVYSKRHKKETMKRLGISEAGDKTGGSFFNDDYFQEFR